MPRYFITYDWIDHGETRLVNGVEKILTHKDDIACYEANNATDALVQLIASHAMNNAESIACIHRVDECGQCHYTETWAQTQSLIDANDDDSVIESEED